MILNQQPKYTELSERDNSIFLTAFPTEETGKEVSSSIQTISVNATFPSPLVNLH